MLLAVLFASCAKTGTVSSPAPGNSTISPEEQSDHTEDTAGPETDDPDALSFWAAAAGNEGPVLQELVADYNASGPEREVRLRLFENETLLYQELQAAIALDAVPDLALLNRDNSIELYERGATADPGKLPGGDDMLSGEAFLPVYLDHAKAEDGRYLGIPFYGTIHVMYYNKEAFASVKLDPGEINTWQDVAEAAGLLQRRLICEEGWELTWGYENLLDAVMSNGGSIYSEDGRTVTINTEEWVSVWEQFRLWLHEDRCMRVHTGGLGEEWLDRTKADALDMTAGGFTASSAERIGLNDSVIGVLPQPAWEEEQDARPGTRLYLLNIFSYSDRAHQEAAAGFARFLTDVYAQVRWATGTGHLAVNREAETDEAYRAYLKAYPEARVAMEQRYIAITFPTDPTGGEIREILSRAADRVLIENIPAGRVLDDAQREAQRALDAVLPPLPEEEETEATEEGEEDVP